MIKNDEQLAYSRVWASKFEEANSKIKSNEEKRLSDPDGWQLIQESNDALRQNLCREIVEYETLVAHNPKEALVLEIEDLNYLPHLLIKARIALKLTPEELAILSDHTEEEIIAFEVKNYHNASFVDFLAVSKALGIKVIAGKFMAQMDDFYIKELIDIRQAKVENINTVGAS